MARLPHDASAGHSDSNTHPQPTVLDANAGHTLTLPGHEYVTDAQMLRDGQDLVLHPAHGQDVIVKNYFSADPAPLLTSAGGGTALTHDLVESFVKPIGGVQYAQNGTMDDASPVGVVKEASGDATITHTNGTVQKAAIGTPIYEGDIVETKEHGAVNITFVDKTTFAVSENAKMAIDQYVFDPATQHGENNFSVLRGVFVFTSGLIGHADPDDVKINTPVGSIGIRGTTIMGTINPGGDSHVSVVEGAIVVSNTTGEQTLSQQFETVKLNGMNQPITSEGVQSADTMANNYNVLRTVSGPLFSTFDDMGKQDDKPGQPGDQAPDAPAAKETAPAQDAAPPAEAAPVNKSDATDPAANAPATATQIALDDTKASLDSGFDTSAGLKTATAFSNDTGIAATTTSSASTSAAATLSAPAAGFSAPSTSAAQTLAPAAPTTTTTAPVPTTPAGTTTPTLPAFTLSVALVPGASDTAGTRVATVSSSITTGVTYSWTSPDNGSGQPLFTLTPLTNGQAGIILTTAGAAYIANLVNGADILYTINATLTDGRTATVNSDFLVPADYDLSLNSVITGSVAGANFIPSIAAGSQHGSSPVSLGDYNHDGRMDYAFVTNTASGGKLFIDDALGNHYAINLANTPFNVGDTTNLIVSGMGDFNGDGKADILIGASRNQTFLNGDIYVMSGGAPGTILSHITGFDDGATAGASISGIGDFNGDGYSDILIGVPGGSINGAAYLILGSSNPSAIAISALSPSQGFAISGGVGLGANVSGIGDFNHDGYSDFAVTDMSANRVSFYYGGAAGLNTGAINITGLTTGAKPVIVSLGDANGDGSSDFGIFDNVADKFYVFQGGASRGTSSFSVTTANFALTSGSGSIINVASAGDFNGDGLSDTALAIRNGSNVEIYVVYGSSTLSGTIDPANIANAYHMHLDLTSTQFNLANPATDAINISLSTGGDLNNDGYDDLLIGLPNVDNNGGAHSNDGGLIIVNGAASSGSITAGMNATASFQSLVGTDGVNNMSNGNAAITNIHFNAGGGNDSISLFGTAGASLIDGGAGIDTLHLMTGGSIDLRNADLSNLENVSMDASGQVLTLTLDQVFTMLHSSENNSLHIDAATTGQLTIDINKTGSGMAIAGFTDAGVSGNYHMYSQGQYTLYVDTDVTVIAQNV